jgi:leucyl/phenylalanyl-tRNA--protein transferase
MTSIDDVMIEITPQVLLKAYACGIFPMAESAEDNALYWIEPERRGILPLDQVHVPRRLARTIRQGGFEVRVDNDFHGVIEGCAAPRAGRRSTWINGRIRNLYAELFRLGHCHTVEVWEDGELIGGLYGVHLGRAFFGESMFSKARDASKIALVYLVARLKFGGFELLDTQFVTTHLARFGAIEVGRGEFQRLLEAALQNRCQNPPGAGGGAGRGGGVGRGAGAAPGAGAGAGATSPGLGRRGLRSGIGAGGPGGSSAAGGVASAPGTPVPSAGASPGAPSTFSLLPSGLAGAEVLQLVSQTSKTGCSTA